jgi:predicted enzyme related to lactoylglutathione lyase
MAARTSYPHGTPSYVDLGAPDVDQAAAFYSALLGWEVVDLGPDAGGYRQAMLDGKVVAGLGPAQDPGPPRWTTYVTVDDVDVAVKAATENGGSVFVEPMDVMSAGRMAVIADPGGAAFAVWQAGESIGSELVNVPGTLCWNELNAPKLDQLLPFYAAMFGWTYDGAPSDGYVQYKVGDRTVGGMLPTDQMPYIPPHWAAYFAVASHDDALAKVKELGGSAMLESQTAEGTGTFSVVADDQGASFCIIELLNADD